MPSLRVGGRPALTPFVRRDALMGTEVLQCVHGIHAPRVAERAAGEIRRLESLWSPFLEGSEIASLARYAGVRAVALSPETVQVLSYAIEMHAFSGGAFDVSLGPVIRLWREAGRRGSPPASEEIAWALGLKGCAEIEFCSGGKGYLPRKGQSVDLGGIGKGFAADRTREIYLDAGIRSGFVNLGGNVSVIGGKPDGSRWIVGIRDPGGGREECIGYVEAEDCSVVTSGAYERFFHIMDPSTGLPCRSDVAGVTVVADSSLAADALSTAAFVLGVEKGKELIESRGGAWAVFIDTAGNIHLTAGTGKDFHLLPPNAAGATS
jgi:thiamine biosynthesis lipoprotein